MRVADDMTGKAAACRPCGKIGGRAAGRLGAYGRVAAVVFLVLSVTFVVPGFPEAEAAPRGAPGLSPAKLSLLRRLDAAHYPQGTYRAGEVVVRLRGRSLTGLSALMEEYSTLLANDAPQALAAFAADPVKRVVRLRLRDGVGELEACRELLSSPLVEAAEPNIVFHAAATNPNDPQYTQQWNLQGAYGVRADQAWDLQKGSPSLYLAVIDTGLDHGHADLWGRIDPSRPGYDYYNNDPFPYDDNGHGTLVTGIACANTNNSLDIAGIDWYAKVIPLKALNASGAGSLDAVVTSVYYAADYGADVINMSLTSSAYSQMLADVLKYAHAQGCVVAAAVGNEGTALVNYPAGMTYVLGVGSTGPGGTRSSFSNHNSSVDLMAPGEGIWGLRMGGGSVQGNGTSEATPHVSGAALLIKEEYSPYALTPDEVFRLLRDGARDLGSPGYDYEYGWGLLDTNASLRVPLVRVTSPADYSYPASGSVSATAVAANELIATLQLLVDGAVVETYYPAPAGNVSHTFSWDLSNLGEGTHEVTVRASTGGGAYRGEHTLTLFRNRTQPRPSTDWYLAEGTTAWGFEEYVCVQNPNPAPVTAQVTFMKPGGATQYLEVPMVANSRLTLYVNSLVPASDVSTHIHAALPVIAERAMYWGGRTDGHASVGSNSKSSDWYLAEGTTAWGFEEWIAVQNPNPEPANLQVTFMKPGGATTPFGLYVDAYARLTIKVNDLVPASDVSTHVHADREVIVERAMYWGGRDGGHGALGVLQPAATWFFAEGSTAWGFEEWIVVQNPNPATAIVNIDLVNASGTRVRRSDAIPPYARYTLNVAQVTPQSDVSAFVRASLPVIAERAMYWSRNGRARAGGHCSTGSITACSTWYLAEGSTAWGFEEYIPLANVSEDIAHATLVFMRKDGSTRSQVVSINAGARYTVYANSLDPNKDIAVRIVSDRPLVAERAMYWSGREGGTDTVGVLQP